MGASIGASIGGKAGPFGAGIGAGVGAATGYIAGSLTPGCGARKLLPDGGEPGEAPGGHDRGEADRRGVSIPVEEA